MGTPIIVEIKNEEASQDLFDEVFDYFKYVDEKFSTYKDTSEITAINNNLVEYHSMSEDMKTIFKLAEETKKETNGYFDIKTYQGNYDPSGIVN